MTQVEKLMKTLDITEDEALQLIADDKAIDKGEKLFELSQEQKQTEKQMRQADRAVNAYGKKVERARKADTDKQEIMRKLLDCFDEYAPQVINAEREFTFTYNGKKFKIVLSAPRS